MFGQIPMFFPKAPISYFSFARNSASLVNCCEVDLHATKSTKDSNTAEGMVNYYQSIPFPPTGADTQAGKMS